MNAVMAPRSGRADLAVLSGAPASSGMLRRRIVSAAILAPLSLAMILGGRPWLQLVALIAAGCMSWEWARLCTGRSAGPTVFVTVAATSAGLATGGFGSNRNGLLVIVVGAVCCFAAAHVGRERTPLLLAAGPVIAAVSCLAFVWLATVPERGVLNALWLLGVVWASDIGAYAAGRTIGGPKLAPRISPNKTWSGSLGGVVAAGIVGALAAFFTSASSAGVMALVSAGLAVVAQAGDLAESAAKRHFGVKDTSNLIPGHGGVLDRLDSLLTAAPTLAALTLVGGSVLTWR